jgi:hypothetical protein
MKITTGEQDRLAFSYIINIFDYVVLIDVLDQKFNRYRGCLVNPITFPNKE